MESENLIQYPRVSIGIPTFNGGKRIHKALYSIFNDPYPNLEVIISDNASWDDTARVCAAICKDHPEVRYIRQAQNIGLIPNFEFVLREASGEYFMWLADDDRVEPGAIEKYVSFLQSHPDYVLVSGAIQYWKGNCMDIVERGFTFTQSRPAIRSISYYARVIYGGMFHGLMLRAITARIPCRNVFGVDYHFVANLAYSGKVKNFDWLGYHKWFGGTSRDNRKYAKAIGESKFAGEFPHLKMASDAFAEVLYYSPVYREMKIISRFLTALGSGLAILYCYYITIFPFKVGGMIKRSFPIRMILSQRAPRLLKKNGRAEQALAGEQMSEAVMSEKNPPG